MSRLTLTILLALKAAALTLALPGHWVAAAGVFFGPDLWVLYNLFVPSAQGLCRNFTRFATGQPEVWLTLDDGPDPDDTPRILDASHLKLLGLIVDEYLNPADGKPNTAEISCLLARLLRRMACAPLLPEQRRDIHSSDDARDVILENINRYVRSHLTEPTTIAQLADALGYSVSYVRTVFRTRLGVSLGKYIRESRLSHASTLLESTELNVSEVAAQAGFESLFVFSRAFKKAFGVSPKVYSQRVSGGRTGRSVKRKGKIA